MVTKQQLRQRMAVIRLRLGGNRQRLTWLVSKEHEYGKLEHFSGKDCVEFILRDPTIVNTPEKEDYVAKINKFILKDGKGYYSIGTTGMGTMVCSLFVNPASGECRVHEDYRTNPILDYLIDHTDQQSNKKIWFQELRIIKPKFLGSEYE